MARTTGENRRKAGCPGENQEIRTGDRRRPRPELPAAIPATYRRPRLGLPTRDRRQTDCTGENQETETGASVRERQASEVKRISENSPVKTPTAGGGMDEVLSWELFFPEFLR